MSQEIRDGKHRVCVIGLGHVGLPLALLFASLGAKVVGCEANRQYLTKLMGGVSPIVERSGSRLAKKVLDESCPNCGVRLLREGTEDFCPNCLKVVDLRGGGVRVTGSTHTVRTSGENLNEMQSLLDEMLSTGRLELTADAGKAVGSSEIVIICVGTPIDSSLKPDLGGLKAACKEVGRALAPGTIVILKSTVPPGTTEGIVLPILERESKLQAGTSFGLAHVPETTLEGLALLGFRTLPKTVGGIDKRSSVLAAAIFSIFGAPTHIFGSPRVTEAAKLFQNIYRDVNIALANELALASEKLDLDVTEVIEAALTEPKTHLLTPGPGAGGYCLPKDTYYLTVPARRKGFKPNILSAARKVNNVMPSHVAALVGAALREKGLKTRGSKVAVLGMSFKANTADTRDSPSVMIVDSLSGAGAVISVHDPLADLASLRLPSAVRLRTKDLDQALEDAEALVLATDHLEYRNLTLDSLKGRAPELKAIVDARHVFDPKSVRAKGYAYRGVGRGAS